MNHIVSIDKNKAVLFVFSYINSLINVPKIQCTNKQYKSEKRLCDSFLNFTPSLNIPK